jgi:putative GTP pyrophosphokinase
MAFPIPKHSRSQINRVGEILVRGASSNSELNSSIDVLSHWRACHGYPVNTFQSTLRKRLSQIDKTALVAQRLKRSASIVAKLKRFEGMMLARMQDIGGLRSVVSNMQSVRKLQATYEDVGRLEHRLISVDDYIVEPKTDGYRSVHLVFNYQNENAAAYNGLRLELQLRTALQHAWATAVETMGTFLGQELKLREGEAHWLRFFELTSSAFAHIERSPLVPGHHLMDKATTFWAVADLESQLNVLQKLRGFALAANAITTTGKKSSGYHLVILDSIKKRVQIRPYSFSELERAMEDYATAERSAIQGDKIEAVLVSAGPIESLRRAYPNYFLDTHQFIRRVQRIIDEVNDKA